MPISIRNLSKRFGDKTVLENLSLTLPDSGVVVIEGRSGAGKTTLLNIIMGLLPPDAGRVDGLAGRRVTAVFQENRLLENWSALKNIRLVCGRGVKDADILSHLGQVGLAGEGKTPVRALSGGMKRRVALVRAVIPPSDILVMDEPFKGLDEETRAQVIRFLLSRRNGRTVILVTHDPAEAAMMGAEVFPLPLPGEAGHGG